MASSPFAFFRGAAAIMASDLTNTPVTGIRAQICGDAHLMNFGGFGTPERNFIFDVNDFDETIEGPWEWDVKRLAASVAVACASLSYNARRTKKALAACLASYRQTIRDCAAMPALEVWYLRIEAFDLLRDVIGDKRALKIEARQRGRTSSHLFPKIATIENGRLRIVDEPPLIVHPTAPKSDEEFAQILREYRDALPPETRVLLDRYQPVDFAFKVVGVGSVGTRCFVALLMADFNDPLVLQIKEAQESVL
ncbi:MAG: DUF2252 domain-containing protein, partial [Candidatus Eremiobacteraeota bacterium]|nr:DUF2252 domain-containing protein [Candidatus Eremiobacteraeota bacterium]